MTDENHAHGGFRQARAAVVASRQWGNITRRQLRAIGFYAFGVISPAPEQRWAAALLAAGAGSALSHTCAAGFFGQLPPREVIEVTAPTQRRGDERLKVHTSRRFEAVRRKGLTVTSPAQTLLDLAAANWPIDRMTHDLAAGGHVSLDALRTFARNRRGEPGARALNKALALPHTRSEWERRFLRWVTRLDAVPAPVTNDPIGPLTVDCHWPGHHLVIELDTDQTHGSAWKQRDDAERDAWLEAQGIEVWHVDRDTWRAPVLEAQLRRRLG